MERKIILGVIGASTLLLIVAMLIPSGPQQQATDLPWQIEPMPGGTIRVFGLTLGESTLAETEIKVRDEAEITLFTAQQDGQPHYVVEAYFDPVNLSGLRAIMVVVLDLPQTELELMYQRGIRIAKLGSGNHKVTLSGDDIQTARQTPIASITYIPRTRLSEELLHKQFGPPELRIQEAENATTHLLYPERGLDIALDERGKAVMQYVMPSRFEQVLEPLREKGMYVND